MGNQRELVIELIKHIHGGQAVAAAYLGISLSVFKDRLYENKGTRFFTCDELLALQQLSETTLVADYFAQQAGCVVVEKPEEGEGNYDLFEALLKIGKARGEYDSYLTQAIADGNITEDEEKTLNQLCDAIVKNRIGANKKVINAHKKS